MSCDFIVHSPPAKRVERTYDPSLRTLCVNIMTAANDDASLPSMSPRDLARIPNAPPRETLKTWKREWSHPRQPPKRRGVVAKVASDQQCIMAGYALFLIERMRVVSIEVLIDFLSSAFNLTVSKSWVSRHMHALGFSSHRPGGVPLKYYNRDALHTAIEFVNDVRPTLNKFGDKQRIVAMDQISFWDNGLVTSSYAPIGGRVWVFSYFHVFAHFPDFFCSGQPRIFERSLGSKVIVYAAFLADGTCWPPVLFTNAEIEDREHRRVRTVDTPEQYAYVHYMPNNSAATTKHTEIWLEDMNNPNDAMIDGPHHLLLDRAPWHTSAEAMELWAQYDIKAHFIPSAVGKWLNPCDQAINREFRRAYNKAQQVRHSDKIDNIIRAFYSIKEKTIKGSFKHTAILKGDVEAQLTKVASEGFRVGEERADDFDKYVQKFDQWANSELRVQSPSELVEPAGHKDWMGLDGAYWRPSGVRAKRRAAEEM
jgi:hypothetical protein